MSLPKKFPAPPPELGERYVPTKDLPGVNGHGRKEIRVSISVILGVVMMLVGVATFASNFIFATKTEVLVEQVNRLESEKVSDSRVSGIRTEVSAVKVQVENLKEDVRGLGTKADVLDANIRKLLMKEGVRPVPKARGR